MLPTAQSTCVWDKFSQNGLADALQCISADDVKNARLIDKRANNLVFCFRNSLSKCHHVEELPCFRDDPANSLWQNKSGDHYDQRSLLARDPTSTSDIRLSKALYTALHDVILCGTHNIDPLRENLPCQGLLSELQVSRICSLCPMLSGNRCRAYSPVSVVFERLMEIQWPHETPTDEMQ